MVGVYVVFVGVGCGYDLLYGECRASCGFVGLRLVGTTLLWVVCS